MEFSHVVYYDGKKYSYNVEIVETIPLVNDYGTGYGVIICIKRVNEVPDHLIISSARDMFADEYTDIWNQRRFRMVD